MTRAIVVVLLLLGALGGLLGAMPAQADSRSIGSNRASPPPPPPPLPIVFTAPPKLVLVPGTQVHYAPGLSVNYFAYRGRHFTYHDGSWFVAERYGGLWTYVAVAKVPKAVLAVPVTYYKIPPGHMKGKGPKHKKDKDD